MNTDTIRSSKASAKPNSGLSLRGLRVFVAVEETGSIGEAATQIGGSPSGVSQLITALESAVGAKLFDRSARPVTLTPAGQVLRVHAHRILEAVSEAQSELAELNLSSLPQLTLAILDDLDASLTPVLVASLQTRFRNCFVNAFSGRSDTITQMVIDRKADIAVSVVMPSDANRYRSIAILREPFILVAAKGAISPGSDLREQLASLPFVQYSEAMPIGRIVAQQMKRLRFKVPRRYAFEASRSVFAMVVQTKGWALTTPLNVLDAERFVPQLDIMTIPFPAFSRRIYLIARNEELGHLPQQLADDCRRLVRERLLPRFSEIAPAISSPIEVVEDE
ncbi:LysR family transcriptional regulator [Mesorhizobium sp. 131-2-1]|uniref:LysR family transcriptional regulator n=1 Tax=Mesorhizobium sp. 131-2-1 TaxID=2744518 RepID=UPI0018EDB112|nr:LysR family transcriptional regulator [Mesorhizobium sp. 131-2-1]